MAVVDLRVCQPRNVEWDEVQVQVQVGVWSSSLEFDERCGTRDHVFRERKGTKATGSDGGLEQSMNVGLVCTDSNESMTDETWSWLVGGEWFGVLGVTNLFQRSA